MGLQKGDLLEKGAIVQRDYKTYAIAPHLPGGICDPGTLRKIADLIIRALIRKKGWVALYSRSALMPLRKNWDYNKSIIRD